MSIDAKNLKRILKNFLEALENKEIISLLDYKQGPEKKLPVSENEYISIGLRPSSSHIIAYTKSPTISYIAEGYGIPLEVRINSYENYSKITLKTTFGVFPEYSPFAIDLYGNIIQDKKLNSTEISEIKKELKNIFDLL